jgi:transposase
MSKRKQSPEPLPTIWQVPDELWARLQPLILELDPPKKTGRRRIPARAALDAMIFRLRSGCQWNRLPNSFPDDSSVHRTFQRWEALGLFEELWATLLLECEELGGVDWHWQAVDCQLGKARGVPKKGPAKNALVPIPPTGPRRAPRKVCS